MTFGYSSHNKAFADILRVVHTSVNETLSFPLSLSQNAFEESSNTQYKNKAKKKGTTLVESTQDDQHEQQQ